MITALAVYALVVGLVFGLLAVVVDRGVRALRGPTRFFWAAAMTAMVLLPAFARLARTRSTQPTPMALTAETVAPLRVPLSAAPAKDAINVVQVSAFERLIDRLQEQLDRIRDSATAYDRVLLVVWAMASAFLLGVLLHALSEARRMRTGLESLTVCGSTVLISEDIGPSATGGNPAAIVIPRWVMALDDSLKSLVIRHELEHVATRDPALLTLALCLLVLMPWHPVLWWSWRRLRLAIEVDCDARVLRSQASPKLYAQLLLLVSQHRSRTPRRQRVMMSLAAPLSPQASQLKQRIDAMTAQPTRHKRLTIVAITAGVAAAGLLIAAVPAPRTKTVSTAGSPLEYRWVTREGADDAALLLPRRTESDSAAVMVSEPFLTLTDVDSIIVRPTGDGEAIAGAVVRADVRGRLRALTRQRTGSQVAVVVDGVVIGVATVNSELGGPLPIFTGSAEEVAALADRLRMAQSRRALVTISKVGTRNVPRDDRGQIAGEILIYGDGLVRVGLGTSEPRLVADTIRLKVLPAFNADVTSGDAHIELRGGGAIELAGTVTGGSAIKVSATGDHLILRKGGTGISTLPPK
jgi:beta-lactamase regulating signal transducer with metallopeptidase domain